MSKSLRLVLLSGLLCAGWLVPSIRAAELPDSVLAFAEVSDAAAADASISGLMGRISPMATPPSISQALVYLARSSDPWAVDTTRPFQFVLLEEDMMGGPVMVFSAKDPERYLDSLLPQVQHQRDEGGLHFYQETPTEGWAAEEWDTTPGRPLVIGAAGERIVLGRTEAAVRAVLKMAAEGGPASGTCYPDATAGASIRVGRALRALKAHGIDPVALAKLQLGPAVAQWSDTTGSQIDFQALIGTVLDGIESVVNETDVLTATVALGDTEYKAFLRVKPADGSALARYVGEMPRGVSELARYAAPDAFATWTVNLGDLSPVVDWYKELMAAVLPSAAQDDLGIKKFADAMQQAMAIVGSSMMVSASRSQEGPLAVTSAMRVKDRAAAEHYYTVVYPQMVKEMGDLMQGMGLKMSFQVGEEPIEYKGHKITEGKFDIQFQQPAGAGAQNMPPGMDVAALQREMVAQMWGEPMRGYYTFVDDIYLYTQGADALERLKGLLDRAEQPAEVPASLAEILKGLPGGGVSAGYVSIEDYANFYVGALATAMEAGGMGGVAGFFNQMHFEVGKPVSFGAWVTEDGAVQERVTVPLSLVDNIMAGITGATAQQQARPVP